MITLNMIAAGYHSGFIKLAESPNDDGVVCYIGEHWFYFGGELASECTVEEYKATVPKEDIVQEIFSTLDDFWSSGGELKDEYLYYEYYLRENGIPTIMNTYGIVLHGDVAKRLAMHYFGFNSEEDEEEYDADPDSYRKTLASEMGAMYYPCFRGSAFVVNEDGSDSTMAHCHLVDEPLYILQAEGALVNPRPVCNNALELVARIQSQYGEYFPDNFDPRLHFAHVSGEVWACGDMNMEIVGYKEFGSTIDITDPCYDKDVWCRINEVSIKPGNYLCAIWKNTDVYPWKYEGVEEVTTDTRVGILGIYLDGQIPSEDAFEELGQIGVDAGLAGFFENKPDYEDEQWIEFCNSLREEDGSRSKIAWIRPEGFFSDSGYGDGCYVVMKSTDCNGDIVALEIRFI